MATTTASDYVIWTKHIHGDPELTDHIARMAPGEVVHLRVGGQSGAWRKMDDGKDGRPTPGIRPVGQAQQHWRQLYKLDRGKAVELERAREITGFSEASSPAWDIRAPLAQLLRSDAERSAALAALLDGAAQGWRSNGQAAGRDEMHER